MDKFCSAILIAPEDNVATVIKAAPPGETVLFSCRGETVELISLGVPIYHKIAVADIPKGGQIRKYGEVIGVATADIPKGAHVHSHNIASGVQ